MCLYSDFCNIITTANVNNSKSIIFKCLKICDSKNIVVTLANQTKRQIDMETTNTIRIPNPSRELVAFIKKAQQEKKERMKKICDKYRKLVNG